MILDTSFFLYIKDITESKYINRPAPKDITIAINNLDFGSFSYLLRSTLEKKTPTITTNKYLELFAMTSKG